MVFETELLHETARQPRSDSTEAKPSFHSTLLRFARRPPHALLLLSSRFAQSFELPKPEETAQAHEGAHEPILDPAQSDCLLKADEVATLAEILCNMNLETNTDSSQLLRHPDLCFVDRTRKVLRLEELDPVRARVVFPPQRARKRLFVIDMAQRLNSYAANSLLKALEEPLSESLFVLTAPSVSHVLPTLVSRCIRIQMGLLAQGNSPERQTINQFDPEDAAFLRTLVSSLVMLDPLTVCRNEPFAMSQTKQRTSDAINRGRTGLRAQGKDTQGAQLVQLAADIETCEQLAKKYPAAQLLEGMLELAATQRMTFGLTWLVAKLRHWQNTREYNPSSVVRLTELVVMARYSPTEPPNGTL